jgi:hypothetical protein
MKPDWKDAPEWAKWLGRDQFGVWWWFELEPDYVMKWTGSSSTGFKTEGMIFPLEGRSQKCLYQNGHIERRPTIVTAARQVQGGSE